jgi:hypothetical protein
MKLIPAETDVDDDVPARRRQFVTRVAAGLALPQATWLGRHHSRDAVLFLSPAEIRRMGVRRVRLKDDTARPTVRGDRMAKPIAVWPVLSGAELRTTVAELGEWGSVQWGRWYGPRSLVLAASRSAGRAEGLLCARRHTQALCGFGKSGPLFGYTITVDSIFVVAPARRNLVAAAMTACVQEQVRRDLAWLETTRPTGMPPLKRTVEGEAISSGGMRMFHEIARVMEDFPGSSFYLAPVEREYD